MGHNNERQLGDRAEQVDDGKSDHERVQRRAQLLPPG